MQCTLVDGNFDEEGGVKARQSKGNGSTYTTKHDSGRCGVQNLHRFHLHTSAACRDERVDPCVRFQRKNVVQTRDM